MLAVEKKRNEIYLIFLRFQKFCVSSCFLLKQRAGDSSLIVVTAAYFFYLIIWFYFFVYSDVMWLRSSCPTNFDPKILALQPRNIINLLLRFVSFDLYVLGEENHFFSSLLKKGT